jgi:uncharacterized protein
MTHPRRWRLFLDANVLVSVSWKDDSKVARLWQIPNVELITSNYVIAECKRNLPHDEQQVRMSEFLLEVRVIDFQKIPVLENPPELPEKDQHVLAAAVITRSDFLVTGDRKHFGAWYGTKILGVRIEPPSGFPSILAER